MEPNLKPPVETEVRRTEIERLAYTLWLEAGQPSGTAERDWLLAEQAVHTGRPITSTESSNGDTADDQSQALSRGR